MIVHLDADAFFASVEQAANSRLRGKAIAVGGLKRGIIASASYEARRHGVYTPMPTSRALRVCPHLIMVPGDYEKYEHFSRFMFTYAYDFTPEVEITSIDEGYFDMSSNRRVKPEAAAEKIRQAISQSLKIWVSEGVASNKLVSQIASKLHKPRGFVMVEEHREREFLAPLEVKWLPGVGPKMQRTLKTAGLTHIGQLSEMPLDSLRMVSGNRAETLREYACARDPRPVVTTREEAKSYGHQRTFNEDTADEERVYNILRVLADDLIEKMRSEERCARTISVKIRYSDMDEVERSESLEEPSNLAEDFYGPIRRLLKKAWDRRVRLRLARVKFSNIYPGFPIPDLLRAEETRKRNVVQEVLSDVRARYGRRALMRSHDWALAASRRVKSD